MIPAVTVLAGMLINSINPVFAVRTANYERNFWLLTPVVTMGLWLLTCFFLIKSKNDRMDGSLGHAWPVWIDCPDRAERQRAGACGFVPTICR